MTKKRIQTLLFLGFLIVTSFPDFSFNQTKEVGSKNNGIYLTAENGKEFSLISEKDKKIMVDSVPIILPMDFERVGMEFLTSTNEPILVIQLTEEGKEKFAKVTRENLGKPLAIILDDNLLSMPVIQSEIPDGKIEVSGLDKKMIEDLVEKFKK